MCELLVRVVDKVNDKNPELDAMLSKRGHVISIYEDGFAWSERCQKNPEWRIIKMRGVPKESMKHLLEPHVAWDERDKRPVLVGPRATVIKFDDANIDASIKEIILDATKQDAAVISKAAVDAVCEMKPAAAADRVAIEVVLQRKRDERDAVIAARVAARIGK